MLNLITVFTNKAKEIDEHFSKPENGEGFDKAGRKILKWAAIIYATCKGVDVAIEWVNKKLGLNTKNNPYNNERGPRFAPKGTPKTNTSTAVQPTKQTSQESNASASIDPHPWKTFRGGGVPDSGTKTPLQGMWIVKERNAIIYSMTNVGKSVLAGQMALDIAAGLKSGVIPMDKAPQSQYVMYYDIEKDGGDFNGRYKSYLESRPELKAGIELFGWTNDYEYVLETIYDRALEKRDIVVFIDNLSALLNGRDVKEFQTAAEKLQRYLKVEKGIIITFVLVMHTNDISKYALLNFKTDIKSDANLSDTFAENVIGLGHTIYSCDSKDKEEVIRIKACKNKSGVYEDPVIVARKVYEPYLHFEQIMMCREKETIHAGSVLPTTDSTFQPDSALADEEVEGWQQLVEHAKYLASDKGKDELEKLKAGLGSEDRYDKMPEEQKAELLALAKTLVNEGYSYRLTSAIILLEKGKYISHDTINRCCKK